MAIHKVKLGERLKQLQNRGWGKRNEKGIISFNEKQFFQSRYEFLYTFEPIVSWNAADESGMLRLATMHDTILTTLKKTNFKKHAIEDVYNLKHFTNKVQDLTRALEPYDVKRNYDDFTSLHALFLVLKLKTLIVKSCKTLLQNNNFDKQGIIVAAICKIFPNDTVEDFCRQEIVHNIVWNGEEDVKFLPILPEINDRRVPVVPDDGELIVIDD